jgi:chromosome segregation ATPase
LAEKCKTSMPKADNTAALAEATRRRSREARERAENAIARTQRTGGPASFAAIAKSGNVSRSWLYTQDDLAAAIRQLQQRQPTVARTGPQPATVNSLRQRLEAALGRIKQLREENSALKSQLETAYGEIRRLRGGAL